MSDARRVELRLKFKNVDVPENLAAQHQAFRLPIPNHGLKFLDFLQRVCSKKYTKLHGEGNASRLRP